MRDLYLHIGLHKTGTTFLQHTLLANRALFAAAGVELGPYLNTTAGSHYPMIRILRDEGFAPASFARLFDEVAATPGEKVLLTAEEFCTAITPFPDRLIRLHAAASRHFRPRVIIYLRRQDFLKESLYTQVARSWYSGNILADDHYELDHDARLAALEAVFGRENIKVVLYRDGKRDGNDLLGGMLTALEIDLDRAQLMPVPAANISAHRRQVLFMAELPKAERTRRSRDEMWFPLRISAALEGSGVIADDRGRFVMSPGQRRDLVARYQAGNRAVVARYGIADPGSFVELPDPDLPWSPPEPLRDAERLRAYALVLRKFLVRRNLLAGLQDTMAAVGTFAKAWPGRGASTAAADGPGLSAPSRSSGR